LWFPSFHSLWKSSGHHWNSLVLDHHSLCIELHGFLVLKMFNLWNRPEIPCRMTFCFVSCDLDNDRCSSLSWPCWDWSWSSFPSGSATSSIFRAFHCILFSQAPCCKLTHPISSILQNDVTRNVIASRKENLSWNLTQNMYWNDIPLCWAS
jgi:hypothetical protein